MLTHFESCVLIEALPPGQCVARADRRLGQLETYRQKLWNGDEAQDLVQVTCSIRNASFQQGISGRSTGGGPPAL